MTRKWDEGEHEGCGVDTRRAMDRFAGYEKLDIVDRLRAEAAHQLPKLLTEAADEIQRLRLERHRASWG